LEARFGGQMKKGQHVATGNCRDERFFGINVRRVGPGPGHDAGRRRGWHGRPAVERPSVFARIPALEEFGAGALPADDRLVFGHNRYAFRCRPQMRGWLTVIVQ